MGLFRILHYLVICLSSLTRVYPFVYLSVSLIDILTLYCTTFANKNINKNGVNYFVVWPPNEQIEVFERGLIILSTVFA